MTHSGRQRAIAAGIVETVNLTWRRVGSTGLADVALSMCLPAGRHAAPEALDLHSQFVDVFAAKLSGVARTQHGCCGRADRATQVADSGLARRRHLVVTHED